MRSLRHGLVGWLLLALLWAPTLGLLHRHVHVPHEAAHAAHAGVQAAPSASAWAAAPGGAENPGPAQTAGLLHDGIASLFASHGEAADCLLYDQCSVADALVSAPLALPAALPVFLLHFFQGAALARWVALYDARGPPPVR